MVRSGGMTRLHRISTCTGPSAGVTVARTKSGPMVNAGCAWEARKTCAGAAEGIDAASASAIPIAAV